MKVILLSGYRTQANEEPLGIAKDSSGQRLLDSRIHNLSEMGLEVVCVLSGTHADEQLRFCPRIANTELVYDTSNHIHLASNLKTGLSATDGEGCFVLPVEVAPPPADLWRFLSQEWRRYGFHVQTSVYQAVDPQGAPWQLGFPLLVTRTGNQAIQKLEDFQSLVDPRLAYHHLVF